MEEISFRSGAVAAAAVLVAAGGAIALAVTLSAHAATSGRSGGGRPLRGALVPGPYRPGSFFGSAGDRFAVG
jgi:hypothetical protein